MKKKALLIVSVIFLSGCQNQANLLDADINKLDPVSDLNDSICTDPPFINPLGEEIYPRDEKYADMEFLGPLFTAYACGSERVKWIKGVEADEYTLGSSIILKALPTKNLMETFKDVDFECGEQKNETECLKWILEKPVKLKEIMKLEPYHQEFKADNCRNCFE